jgi:hypothetical protein
VSQHKRGDPIVGHFITRLGVYTASPVSFLVLIVYAALWYVLTPETFEWHAVATLATWAYDTRHSASGAPRHPSDPCETG